MKYVVLYQAAPEVHQKARPHAPARDAHLKEFHERGELLMIGTFADVQAHGAMAILRTREGAEQFAEADPFVLNGVVSQVEIREWNEILAD
jgi:uncharacterized protein YciI